MFQAANNPVYVTSVYMRRPWFVTLILITLNWSICFGQTSSAITPTPTIINVFIPEDIGECATTPCLNASACIDNVNSRCFYTTSDDSFFSNCENSVRSNGYFCWCEPGWTGTRCEINIDECAPTPCLNGGTCHDGINQFTCDCVSGFTGSRCQFDTIIEVNNVTVPVCRKHLCESMGCSEGDQTTPKFCHCDKACKFFDDCCADYKDACSHDQQSEFQSILQSRDLATADRECVTVDIDPSTRILPLDGILFSDDSYWMVSKCSKDLGVVSKRCQEPVCNDTLSTIPVIDSLGITYRNVYCAVCHNVRTSELTAWETILDCRYFPPDLNEIDVNFLCSTCRLILNPPAIARKCEPRARSRCVSDADEARNAGCKTYTALIDVSGKIYRNPHCFLCSIHDKNVTFDDYDVNCGGTHFPIYTLPDSDSESCCDSQRPGPNPGYPGGLPLSVVLDFGSSSSVKILRNTDIIIETTITCPEGEVYVEHQDASSDCIPVRCDEGFNLQDGKCLPKTSDLPCGTDELNTTIYTLTVTLHTEACKHNWFKNVSEELLPHLFGTDLLDDVIILNVSITCTDRMNSVDFMYTVGGTADLLEMIQDQLAVFETINSLQSFPQISSSMINKLEITKSCLESDLEYTCDTEWISENEYTLLIQNGSYVVFLNKSLEWITPNGVEFRVRYQTDNATNKFNKDIQIKICHLDSYLSCPYIRLNVSLFGNLNSSDGMIKYIPNGHVLKPTEYVITANDEILACNFLNQSGVRNVTHTELFEYSNAQTIVSIVGSALSLTAVILTFLTYAVFASLRNRASRLIMNLICALFLGQFLLLFGGNRTENENACVAIAVITHYAWLAAFAWMNALAFELDRTFGNPNNLQKVGKGKKSMFLYMIYAWGSPFLVIIPCLVLHFCQCTHVNFKYGSANACWINDGTANLLTFGVPAAIFLLFNVILFGHTVVGIRSAKRATARLHQDTSTLKRTTDELLIYIKIASLMGFTWIFGYVAAFTGIEALWYIFIILNSLQGLFIFFSFMCNRRVGLLWSEKLKLTSPKAAQKSSTSGTTDRNRAASAPGTQMTGYYSSTQSDFRQDGSDQPLKEETKV
ncbi:LOW QUALITY PROTEIN: uncharacterized protein [Amphiura filiformis]|uniref:LOW QUALITY PROTEIN: uncharacterized protein n=1 Tax=Amphiura filiformis TaxID=82378 RepID=UPI003B217E7C